MKAAEDQVVEDDARFQDDEVGLCTQRFFLEESLLPFTLELLCVSPNHFCEQNQIKSDKEIMQMLSDKHDIGMCKILHIFHNHTQIHISGVNNYYIASH